MEVGAVDDSLREMCNGFAEQDAYVQALLSCTSSHECEDDGMADTSDRRDDAQDEHLPLYLHLARASELRRQPLVRDRLLVIAAAAAARTGLNRIAALCRDKILNHNAGHMFRRWDTVELALVDDDFESYLKQMERRFPPEKAEQMLQSLGVDISGERDVYYDDEEYAASIWGLSPSDLREMFPGDAPPGEPSQ